MKIDSSSKGLYFDTVAYAALFATIIIGAAAFAGSTAGLVEHLYPVIALLAAALLLWRKPATYLAFMWWMWFLTPEVRRLIDYRVGYTEQSLVMLTPFLVTGIALFAVLSNINRLQRTYRFPLALSSFGLLYAYAIGVLNNSLAAATFDLLTWGVPIVSAAYLLTHQRYSLAFRKVTQQTFMWGLLIMGCYSIVQYFYLPPWDAYWMDNAGIVSIGISEPQQVRVFGTLNSAGPFADVIMAGLLLTFSGGGLFRFPGVIAGFIGFALSAVRSAWGGWVVGFVVIATSLPLRIRTRLLGTLLLLTIVGIPLFSVGPVAALLSQRLESVTSLESDSSFNARLKLYSEFSSFTAGNPLGQGLGSTGVASGISNDEAAFQNLDSGIIAVIYTFGALGTLYYVGGAFVLFGIAFWKGLKSKDITYATYTGITAAMLSQLIFGNVWGGSPGMLLWFFPSLLLASHLSPRMSNVQKFHQPSMKGPVRVYQV